MTPNPRANDCKHRGSQIHNVSRLRTRRRCKAQDADLARVHIDAEQLARSRAARAERLAAQPLLQCDACREAGCRDVRQGVQLTAHATQANHSGSTTPRCCTHLLCQTRPINTLSCALGNASGSAIAHRSVPCYVREDSMTACSAKHKRVHQQASPAPPCACRTSSDKSFCVSKLSKGFPLGRTILNSYFKQRVRHSSPLWCIYAQAPTFWSTKFAHICHGHEQTLSPLLRPRQPGHPTSRLSTDTTPPPACPPPTHTLAHHG